MGLIGITGLETAKKKLFAHFSEFLVQPQSHPCHKQIIFPVNYDELLKFIQEVELNPLIKTAIVGKRSSTTSILSLQGVY